MNKRYIAFTLQLLAGLTFVFSGFIKLFPAEMLEIAIVDTGLIGWKLAPFAARILIAFEIFIGIMLISRLYTGFFLKLSLLTLIFFTIYLIYLFLAFGNEGNCNCFGSLLPMTPMESIIKNILMIAMIIYLMKLRIFVRWRFSLIVLIVSAILSAAVSFALAPIVVSTYQPSESELNYRLELELVYDDPDAKTPLADVREDKWIVAFLSSSCPHCNYAGHKFHIMSRQLPEMKLYMFINGYDDEIKDFVKETRTEEIPHSRINAAPIIKLAGARLPVIFWLENSVVVNKTTIYGFNNGEVREWFADTKTE